MPYEAFERPDVEDSPALRARLAERVRLTRFMLDLTRATVPDVWASLDRQLAELVPVVLVDGLRHDLGRRGQVRWQVLLRLLEVVRPDVGSTRVTVAEGLDEHVLVRVVQTA